MEKKVRNLLSIQHIKRINPNSIEINLSDYNIQVGPSEVVTMIGSNGSGKTTLLEALVGVRRDYEVTASLLGFDLLKIPNFEKANLGVCFQSSSFSEGVKVKEIIRLHSRSFKIEVNDKMLIDFELDNIQNSLFAKLSGGQRRRLLLYFALAHNPIIAILDEPDASMDHQGIGTILNILDDRRKKNLSTVIATHNPAILSIAQKVVYIKDGSVIYFGKKNKFFTDYLGSHILEVDAEMISSEQYQSLVTTEKKHCFSNARKEKLFIFGNEASLDNVLSNQVPEIKEKSILRELRPSDVFSWINHGEN